MLAIHLNFKYQMILIINKLKYEEVQNQLKHDTRFEPTLNTLSSEAASPLSFDSTLIRYYAVTFSRCRRIMCKGYLTGCALITIIKLNHCLIRTVINRNQDPTPPHPPSVINCDQDPTVPFPNITSSLRFNL